MKKAFHSLTSLRLDGDIDQNAAAIGKLIETYTAAQDAYLSFLQVLLVALHVKGAMPFSAPLAKKRLETINLTLSGVQKRADIFWDLARKKVAKIPKGTWDDIWRDNAKLKLQKGNIREVLVSKKNEFSERLTGIRSALEQTTESFRSKLNSKPQPQSVVVEVDAAGNIVQVHSESGPKEAPDQLRKKKKAA